MTGLASAIFSIVIGTIFSWFITVWIATKTHIYLAAPFILCAGVYGIFTEDSQIAVGIGMVLGALLALVQDHIGALPTSEEIQMAESDSQIRRLQNDLIVKNEFLGRAIAKGDLSYAGVLRGEIAQIESKLRRLGA